MTTKIIQQTIALELRECPTCGVTYGVTELFIAEHLKNHVTFYCPNGHARYFPSQSREEILAEENQHLKQKVREINQQSNDLLQELGRVKKRANAGVCPQCRRHFVNVQRHIESKHKR